MSIGSIDSTLRDATPPLKLGRELCSRICDEVRNSVIEIFGENLVFGFVCGGIAKGYADTSHDIDLVVCTKSPPDTKTMETYYDWYFNLHDKYNLPPDYDYPGEVVTCQQFMDTLSLLPELRLTLHITEVKIKKAIIWGDMLTGGIDGLSGDTCLIGKLIETYKNEPSRWKEQVLQLIPPEDVASWIDKNHTLIMERYMKYPKYDGKKLDLKYGRNQGKQTNCDI